MLVGAGETGNTLNMGASGRESTLDAFLGERLSGVGIHVGGFLSICVVVGMSTAGEGVVVGKRRSRKGEMSQRTKPATSEAKDRARLLGINLVILHF